MSKLLIVDDEEGVRALVSMTLDSGAYEIFEARDGAQALQMAREHRPDLVLLDVMLPDMSGVDVCRRLKADPATAKVTIVMLTARAQSTDLTDAEGAGADGYFTKPFSPIALTRKVESILGQTSAWAQS
ncbi:MAG TPA: response regulator [Acidimicrobiales bacterium]|nr:response regulator [Acidimicrobiales bacterium]